MSIIVIDLGLSNLKSLCNSLNQIGINFKITKERNMIKKARKVILPGVGSFPDAMNSLKKIEILSLINNLKESKKPLLGICLGMQILADIGNENKRVKGLSLIPGEVKKIPRNLVDQIPNIGWCNVEIKKKHFILDGIPNNASFYFIHSFYFLCNEQFVYGLTGNGFRFPSIVCKDNFVGVQFHPEKSYDYGLKLLSNFCNNDN